MPQNPIGNVVAKILSTGKTAFLALDDSLNLLVKGAVTVTGMVFGGAGALLTTRSTNRKLNIAAAAVVKVGGGVTRAAKVIIIAPGSTGGAFTLNDCAATADASAANEIWTLPFGSTLNLAGAVFDLDIPCTTGLVVSAVPTGGSPIIAVTYI